MSNTILLKRGLDASLSSLILQTGEPAFVTDTSKLYIGNGSNKILINPTSYAAADKWATARTFSLSGDVTGSVSVDGSANVTLTATVVNDSHNHSISTVTGLQSALDLKSPLASPTFTGIPAAPTATAGTNTTQLATTAFVTSAVSSATSGNVATATKLATARTISATGDATWSVTFDGSANATSTLTLASSGVTAGTYKSVTVDAKGRVTAATNPTTLAGYGITDALNLAGGTLTGGLTATTFTSNVATGTAPLVVASTTKVTNLNAELLDGYDSSYFAPIASPTFTGTVTIPTLTITGNETVAGTLGVTGTITGASTVQGTRLISTVATGTAPLTVSSTTLVSNLNAQYLNGQSGSYYAPLASPALTGTPTAPTATAGTNTTQLATTAFVSTAVSNLVNAAPAALDTLNELAAALGNDASFSTTVTNSLALKAPLASPALTGTPTAPTATAGTSTTQLATTAFVGTAIATIDGGTF